MPMAPRRTSGRSDGSYYTGQPPRVVRGTYGFRASRLTSIFGLSILGATLIGGLGAATPLGQDITFNVVKFLLFYAGVLALIAMTAAVGLGLVATDRIIMTPGRRITAQAVHRAVALSALTFLVIHIVLEIAATRSTVADAFIPFLAQGRTFYIALGTIASDLIVVLVITGFTRPRFAKSSHPWAWRATHATAYAAWIFAIIHGLLGGRAAKPYVDWSYGGCLAAVALALVVRFVATSRSREEVALAAGEAEERPSWTALPSALTDTAMPQLALGSAATRTSSQRALPAAASLPAGPSASLLRNPGMLSEDVTDGRVPPGQQVTTRLAVTAGEPAWPGPVTDWREPVEAPRSGWSGGRQDDAVTDPRMPAPAWGGGGLMREDDWPSAGDRRTPAWNGTRQDDTPTDPRMPVPVWGGAAMREDDWPLPGTPARGFPAAAMPPPAMPQPPLRPQAMPQQPMPYEPMSQPPLPPSAMPQQPMPYEPMSQPPLRPQQLPHQVMPHQAMPQQPMPQQPVPWQQLPRQAMPYSAPSQPMPYSAAPSQPMPYPAPPSQPMPYPAPPPAMSSPMMPPGPRVLTGPVWSGPPPVPDGMPGGIQQGDPWARLPAEDEPWAEQPGHPYPVPRGRRHRRVEPGPPDQSGELPHRTPRIAHTYGRPR